MPAGKYYVQDQEKLTHLGMLGTGETICGLSTMHMAHLTDEGEKVLAIRFCSTCAQDQVMFVRKPGNALHAAITSRFQPEPTETLCGRDTAGMVKVAGGSSYVRNKCGKCQRATVEIWENA